MISVPWLKSPHSDPVWTFRGGLTVFAGAAEESYSYVLPGTPATPSTNFNAATGGTHWGGIAYFGATAKVCGITVEPFVYGGLQEWNMDSGNGASLDSDGPYIWTLNRVKKETLAGSGLSVLF